MDTLAHRLLRLSSAEDFFDFFGLPYDESVLNVSRLHILKRFFQYMNQEKPMHITDEVEMYRTMHRLLAKSYSDFVQSTPVKEKMFKILRTADGQCVSIETLKPSLKPCC